MATIKKDGYYVSEPFHWEDSHAGHKSEGDIFYLIRFNKDNCFFDSVDDYEKIGKAVIKEVNPSNYSINADIIEIIHNPNTEFAVKRIFKIQSLDVILDEKSKKYTFHKM